MPLTWTPEELTKFLASKLSIETNLASALANGIMNKWEEKTVRIAKTRFYVACLQRNGKLVHNMKSGDLSIDTLLSMLPDQLKTEDNQQKKKNNVLQAQKSATITPEISTVWEIYETGQDQWRGQHKQKINYAKIENKAK